jgi:hypothetical protein
VTDGDIGVEALRQRADGDEEGEVKKRALWRMEPVHYLHLASTTTLSIPLICSLKPLVVL